MANERQLQEFIFSHKSYKIHFKEHIKCQSLAENGTNIEIKSENTHSGTSHSYNCLFISFSPTWETRLQFTKTFLLKESQKRNFLNSWRLWPKKRKKLQKETGKEILLDYVYIFWLVFCLFHQRFVCFSVLFRDHNLLVFEKRRIFTLQLQLKLP